MNYSKLLTGRVNQKKKEKKKKNEGVYRRFLRVS